MKRSLWLLMYSFSPVMSLQRLRILPVRGVCKPDHGYLLELYFPALAGQYKVSQGKVPDTANPSMPIQIFRHRRRCSGVSGWPLVTGSRGADGRHPITGMHG